MGKDGQVFGPANTVPYNGASVRNWMCENLKGYSSKMSTKYKKITGDCSACTNYGLAEQWESYSALEYLPTTELKAKGSTGHTKDSVDWESIMLCKSPSITSIPT